MESSDFIKLVADMRHAQKEYFRTRSGDALEASKRLEKAVDTAIRTMGDKQKELFNE